MKCPSCKNSTSVKNVQSYLNFVSRSRICYTCKHSFRTVEIEKSYYKRLRYEVKQKIQKIMRRIEEVCEI